MTRRLAELRAPEVGELLGPAEHPRPAARRDRAARPAPAAQHRPASSPSASPTLPSTGSGTRSTPGCCRRSPTPSRTSTPGRRARSGCRRRPCSRCSTTSAGRVALTPARRLVFINGHGGNSALRQRRQPRAPAAPRTDDVPRPPGRAARPGRRLGRPRSSAWVSTAGPTRRRSCSTSLPTSSTWRPPSVSVPEHLAENRYVRFGGPVTFGWLSDDFGDDGVIGDPTAATAERGGELFEGAVDGLLRRAPGDRRGSSSPSAGVTIAWRTSRPRRQTHAVPAARWRVAARSDGARTASRSAGAPGAIGERRSVPARRASSATAAQASAGDRWAASTISAAVSNGQARPSGLNGSCRLSPPAATTTPAVAQRLHRGQPARHRLLLISTLQIEVRRREGDHRDAGRGDRLGELPLALDGLHAEADAVAGGDRVGRSRSTSRCRRARRDRWPTGRASRRCAGRRRRRGRRRSRARSPSRPRMPPSSRCGQPPTRSAPARDRVAQQRPLRRRPPAR